MEWVFLDTKQNTFLSPLNQPYFLSHPPPPPPSSNGFNLSDKVSPSILLIIIILAIIFFISGLLHLLVRFLIRPTNRDPDEFDNVTALQGQLQQLFNLHDSGVDQSFIDTLPVFNYKAIIGLKKSPFDCAVCLCEFESEDKLRLLPKCSHAFHMDCIDTWLLSHSTCPLCRASIAPDFSPNSSFSPIVLVLESGSESSREIFPEREGSLGTNNSIPRSSSQVGFPCDGEIGSTRLDFPRKSWEKQGKAEENQEKEKVVTVKLGKFKNVDNGGEGSSNVASDNNFDGRRCFSMGSFEYIMDENSLLKVPIKTPMNKKQTSKKSKLPLTPGHRMAMSECGWDSTREFSGFEALPRGGGDTGGAGNGGGGDDSGGAGNVGNVLGRSKRESFSISKIWLQGKKERQNSQVEESSRRAVSFRFPVHRNVVAGEEIRGKNGGGGGTRTIGEIIESARGGNERGSEFGVDEEIHSFHSLDSQANSLSFARRTLFCLMGRQNKVVHSSFPTNV